MGTLGHDIRLAFRALRRNGLVTFLAVTSLALAICGNSVVFSLVSALLFRPLPYQDSEHLMLVWSQKRGGVEATIPLTEGQLMTLEQRSRTIGKLAALNGVPVNLTEGETPERITGAEVTPGFFRILGVSAARGRTFLDEEGVEGRDQVVVLSHRAWEERFGGDPEILGRSVSLDGFAFTVVGVLPEDFEFLDPSIEMFLPLVLDRTAPDRERQEIFVVARLAPGVAVESAQSELGAIARQLEKEHPDTDQGWDLHIRPMFEQIPDARNRQLLALVQGALVFVLLIACANIANLLLARGWDRQREIALRTTLGAGRTRIFRQLITESLVLGVTGGLLGLGLAAVGIRLMNAAFGGQLPRQYTPALDGSVLVFTVVISLVGGLIFGVAPALQGLRVELMEVLREGGRGSSAGGKRRLVTNALVVGEIALALVLLGGAGVLVRSFVAMQHSDAGFDTAQMLTMRLTLPERRYQEDAEVVGFHDQLLERLAAVPGVSSATATTLLPRSPFAPSTTFTVDGRQSTDEPNLPSAAWLAVSHGYFDTLGLPVLRGRAFGTRDGLDAAKVVMVSESLARRFWPGEDAVANRISVQGASREVVGVVPDLRIDLFRSSGGATDTIYLPIRQLAPRGMAFVLRTTVEPHSVAEPVRKAIWSLDPHLPPSEMLTLEEFAAQFFVGANIISTILGLFGLVALLLAAVGIYGVLAYSVAQRTHEIGVRMAIGATRGRVLRMVTRQGLVLAGIGFIIGIPGVWLVTRAIQGTLSDIAPVEPVTVLGTGLALLLVTAAAAYLPARRAANLDPTQAMRFE